VFLVGDEEAAGNETASVSISEWFLRLSVNAF
jgi:hypothetical protein